MTTRLLLGLLLGLAAPLSAHEYRIGTITVHHPVIRVATPVAKTGAGYFTIRNDGKTEDRLLSVTTSAANRSDLHGTVSQGNVMQMRAQTAGVAVPAGGTVSFAPGGLHVMFIGLKAPVPPGTRLKAQLIFAKAGTIDVEFTGESVADTHNH